MLWLMGVNRNRAEYIEKIKTAVTEITKRDEKEVSEWDRRTEREAPQQGLKAAKPERSFLPPSHIIILILMRLPVFPPSVFPLRRFEHEKLKKRKFQELRITVWPGATQQTPTMTDSLFKASRSCFHQGILVVFLQCDTTSPCHLPFSKIRTSRCAFCLCIVFRWASQPRPSTTQAFAAMRLVDCCLHPRPTVWHDV